MIPFSLDSARFAIAALLLAGTASACSDDDPTGPTPMAFEGQGTLAADATVGVVPCTVPTGDVVTAFPALLRSTGQFTGMGTTLGEIRATACTVEPGTGTVNLTGDVLQTGADGASLDATFAATVRSDGQYDLDVSIVGGSGRYDGASGWLEGGGLFDPTTGAGNFELSGELVS